MTGSLIPPSIAGAMAEAIAAAAVRVAGVDRLSGGKFGQIATYAPGRKVTGVRVSVDHIEVHVVAEWVSSLPHLAEDVRTAVAPLAEGRPVSVFVDDITQVEIQPAQPQDAKPQVAFQAPPQTSQSDDDTQPGRPTWAKTLI